MNKLYLLLALIAICLIGCSSDDDELPVVPNIEIEVSNFEISQVANSKTVAHFETNVTWTATITYQGEEKDWLTIDPQKGDANKAVTMTMEGAVNNSSDDRTAYVTITYGDKTHKLTIKQKRKDTISEIVDQVFVGGDGGQVTISLKTDIDDFTVIIPEEAQEWLSYSKTKAIESKEIVLTAKKNPEKLSRWTSVTITNSDKIESREVFIGQTADGETIEGCYYIVGGDMKNLAPADATVLKLFGKPNVEDFYYMRDQMCNLAKLDLSGTVITEIVDNAFSTFDPFTWIQHDPKESLMKIVFPERLVRIGNIAFTNCTNLEGTLTIPPSVTEIGDHAFARCSGLVGALVIPEGIISIGKAAFYECSGFGGSLIIPNGVKEIEDYTFAYCSGFSGSLTFSKGVTRIGDYAFAGCSGLKKELTIPNTVIKIGNRAFADCSGFTGSLIIPDGVIEMGGEAFLLCTGFEKSLIIGNGLEIIRAATFWGCLGLISSVTIGGNVKEIEDYAFCELRNIEDVYCLAIEPPVLAPFGWHGISPNMKLYVPAESVVLYKNSMYWKSIFNNGENVFALP